MLLIPSVDSNLTGLCYYRGGWAWSRADTRKAREEEGGGGLERGEGRQREGGSDLELHCMPDVLQCQLLLHDYGRP